MTFSRFILLSSIIVSGTCLHCKASTPDDADEYEVWDIISTTSEQPAFPAENPETCHADETPFTIMGAPKVDAATMHRFVSAYNADFPMEIAQAYHSLGLKYGIRGDVALCQAIVETGWFRFADGTAVTPDQHNYCGLGVTSRGMKGSAFECVEDGVRAQLQHLYAYACREPLPEGEQLIDPRFSLVQRGVAPTWMDLSGRWAANDHYGMQIRRLYERLLQMASEQASK